MRRHVQNYRPPLRRAIHAVPLAIAIATNAAPVPLAIVARVAIAIATNVPGSGPGSYRGPGGYRDRDERGPGNYRPVGPGTLDTPGYRPRQPMEGGFNHGPRPGTPGNAGSNAKRDNKPPRAKTPKPQSPPKPKREKIPPPTPFVPTPEQIAQVETRYLELAVPAEFDGIRTQIATELSIPKKAVKKIVNDLRQRDHIPSWWETQVYKGDSEELAKIKAAYEPYLPVPPVGVHKKIADELELKAGIVYQAIKAIRLELNLPQFNDPSLHGEELAARKQAKEPRSEAPGETDSEAAKPADGSQHQPMLPHLPQRPTKRPQPLLPKQQRLPPLLKWPLPLPLTSKAQLTILEN